MSDNPFPSNSPDPDPTPPESTLDEGSSEGNEQGALYTQEEGDNSVLVSDEGYVGVTAEYRNAAYDHLKPMVSEDEDRAKAEREAKEREEARAAESQNVGFRGYTPNSPHPTEQHQNPSDFYTNANRSLLEKAAEG